MKNIFTVVVLVVIVVMVYFLIGDKSTVKTEFNQTLQTEFNFDTSVKSAYKLKYISDIEIYLGDKNTNNDRFNLSGILNFKVLKNVENDVIAAIQLSELSIDSSNITFSKELKKLYSELFLIEFAKDGTILNTYFKYKKEDYNGIAQLLAVIQTILQDKMTYNQIEDNHNGSVGTKYIRDDKNGNKIDKKRLKYISMNDNNININIVNSNTKIKIDKQWIDEVDSVEQLEVYQNGTKLMKTKNIIRLTKQNHLIDNSLEIWQYKYDVENTIEQYNKKSKVSYFEEKAKEQKKQYFTDNKITIDKLTKNIKDSHDLKNLKRLENYITLNPNDAVLLYNVIKNSKDILGSALINVLENSGTPEAQIVLTKIADSDEFNHMNHLRAVVALGGLEKPTKESIEFLWNTYDTRFDEDSDDLSNTSLLAIGALSTKIDKEENKLINERLKTEYSASSDETSKLKVILLSMQNANSANFQDEIFNSLENNSNLVRATAAQCLRGVNTDEVKYKMLNMLKVDESRKVKINIISTLNTIDPNDALVSQINKDILKEDDNFIRRDMIEYLLKYQDKYPKNKDTLKQLKFIETDRDNQVLLLKNNF